MSRLDAQAIHSQIGPRWPAVLMDLGIDESFLSGRHGPCPACGGTDRFRFLKGDPRGRWFCCPQGNGCGRGDAFELLQRVHGWSFKDARSKVIEAARLDDSSGVRSAPAPVVVDFRPEIARPTSRVKRIRLELCSLDRSDDAIRYLSSRSLWPMPAGHALRAHASLDYYEGPVRIGRFPALVADVRDIDGELVTVHVTYLENGAKFCRTYIADGEQKQHDPRKILSKMQGRVGCAARLMPLSGEVLGIAEGVETALSAAKMHALPVWSTLNAGLLASFEPPAGISKLVLFADRDFAGMQAVSQLMERLQGRYRFELKSPPQNRKDWNDVLKASPGADDPFGEMQA